MRQSRQGEVRLALLVSSDGDRWTPVTEVAQTGALDVVADVDPHFPPDGPARYRYLLRIEMQAARSTADVGLDALFVENDLQMAPLSLPGLALARTG